MVPRSCWRQSIRSQVYAPFMFVGVNVQERAVSSRHEPGVVALSCGSNQPEPGERADSGSLAAA